MFLCCKTNPVTLCAVTTQAPTHSVLYPHCAWSCDPSFHPVPVALLIPEPEANPGAYLTHAREPDLYLCLSSRYHFQPFPLSPSLSSRQPSAFPKHLMHRTSFPFGQHVPAPPCPLGLWFVGLYLPCKHLGHPAALHGSYTHGCMLPGE